jgi:hypothetical protein
MKKAHPALLANMPTIWLAAFRHQLGRPQADEIAKGVSQSLLAGVDSIPKYLLFVILRDLLEAIKDDDRDRLKNRESYRLGTDADRAEWLQFASALEDAYNARKYADSDEVLGGVWPAGVNELALLESALRYNLGSMTASANHFAQSIAQSAGTLSQDTRDALLCILLQAFSEDERDRRERRLAYRLGEDYDRATWEVVLEALQGLDHEQPAAATEDSSVRTTVTRWV